MKPCTLDRNLIIAFKRLVDRQQIIFYDMKSKNNTNLLRCILWQGYQRLIPGNVPGKRLFTTLSRMDAPLGLINMKSSLFQKVSRLVHCHRLSPEQGAIVLLKRLNMSLERREPIKKTIGNAEQ